MENITKIINGLRIEMVTTIGNSGTSAITLNCDMGESFGPWHMGNDENIMPYLDMANIACGFHASDPVTMDKTVKLALKHDVVMGAHPAYPDLVGFGRRTMKCKGIEIRKMIVYQTGALAAICKANASQIRYIKPHGALNNDMMRDDALIQEVMTAVAEYDTNLKLMIVSTPRWKVYREMADKLNIELLYEAFADRLYDDEGQLTSRTNPLAVHNTKRLIIRQVENILSGHVLTETNNEISIHADSICLHGDNIASIEAAPDLRKLLDTTCLSK